MALQVTDNNGGNGGCNPNILSFLGMSTAQEDFLLPAQMEICSSFHIHLVAFAGSIGASYHDVVADGVVVQMERPDLVSDSTGALELINTDPTANRLYFAAFILCPSVYNDIVRRTGFAHARAAQRAIMQGNNTLHLDWDQSLILGFMGKFTKDGGFFQARFSNMKENTVAFLWSLMKTIFRDGGHPSVTSPRGILEDDGTIVGPLNGLLYLGNGFDTHALSVEGDGDEKGRGDSDEEDVFYESDENNDN